MKLKEIQFGLAVSAALAVLWIICSALVLMSPGFSMNMSGHMMHANFQSMNWTLTPFGVFLGLVGWAIAGGFFGWLVAFFYNNLSRNENKK